MVVFFMIQMYRHELGKFYNGLGGTASTQLPEPNSKFDLFINVQSYYYWTSTYFPSIPGSAWDFDFTNGSQYNRACLISLTRGLYIPAMSVRYS